MSLLTIAFLSLFFYVDVNQLATSTGNAHGDLQGSHMQPFDIDTNDQVIFDFDQITFDGDIIEVPVYITSDDMIFSLDFSMLLNIEALEYESVVDHTGELQYTAYFKPEDSKLRFTSNNFSPYPTHPDKVISIRFKVLHGVVHLSDFAMVLAYLNGVGGCSFSLQLQGDEIFVANNEIITNETFITPNPAGDVIYVSTKEEGTLDMFNAQGIAVIRQQRISTNASNEINVEMFPRGTYTVHLISKDHNVKTQRIVLQ